MREPISRKLRIVLCAYLTAVLTSSLAIGYAYWNVSWHDPYRTPRWTPYFMLWWGFRDTLQPVVLLLVVIGFSLALIVPRSGWCLAVWLGLGLSLYALYLCLD